MITVHQHYNYSVVYCIIIHLHNGLVPFQSASRYDLSELVSMGKYFEENVKEFMETKVNDLRPVCLTITLASLSSKSGN